VEARRAAQGETGTLSIGYVGAALSHFLPELIHAYRTKYPAVRIQRSIHRTWISISARQRSSERRVTIFPPSDRIWRFSAEHPKTAEGTAKMIQETIIFDLYCE
jgi:DNA-binding transcriptional LysR family regulator